KEGTRLQPIRKSKSDSFSKKDTLQARVAATPKLRHACQHTGGLVLSRLYTAKHEQSFLKGAKSRKRASKQRRLIMDKLQICEVQRYFGCGVRASPLRSNHNTRKNGISESTK